MNILVTGGAGFIGFHLTKRLLSEKYTVVTVDNLNHYYDVALKKRRLAELEKIPNSNYHFFKLDINDEAGMGDIFEKNHIDAVVNLAAQAGVRYARENPDSYIKSNVTGFYTLIQSAARHKVKRFLYASSSSVYGANVKIPFSENDQCSTPMSLYAATKLSDEAIASAYSFTDDMQTIGLRFFNVYGAWGRPDMAYYKWTENLMKGEEVELRNNGEMWRDMTYVDDVVESIVRLLSLTTGNDNLPLITNIGNREPVKIMDMLNYLAKKLDKNPRIRNVPKGSEEPVKTWSDVSRLEKIIGFSPHTNYREGLDVFLEWYRKYYA